MAKILVTAGPIPARLDSVKYITNRFKGGLALLTAETLRGMGHEVTVMAWQHADIKTLLPVIRVNDVYDYYDKVLDFEADGYILAAAVANLGPVEPIKGKFPSHLYKVGEVFPIDFTIMPRVIDAIKEKRPRATLIGYKLFDGSMDELLSAAKHTLHDSKANLVFANHPSWAKERKVAVTADGAAFELDFKQHIELIDQLMTSEFYQTQVPDILWESLKIDRDTQYVIDHYPRYPDGDLTYGTFAVRLPDNSFITTTRGKKEGDKALALVLCVDHDKHIVRANKKATLNAPLLERLFSMNPHINYLVHGHKSLGYPVQNKYQFPGTTDDLTNAQGYLGDFVISMPHHGYIAGFQYVENCKEFLNKHEKS